MFEAIVLGLLAFGIIGASNDGLNDMKGVKDTGDKFCVKIHDVKEDQMKLEILKKCEK